MLRLLNNKCIINSNSNYIKHSKEDVSIYKKIIGTDPGIVSNIISNHVYYSLDKKSIYYYNINELPLSNKKYYCDNKEIYLKNYGNDVVSVSMLLSAYLNKNVDPIETFNFALDNNLVSCENGVDIYRLLDNLLVQYDYHVVRIPKENVSSYVRNGGVVLSIVNHKDFAYNFSCNKSSIIIYSIDKNNNYRILDSNDRNYEYICPDNTDGYGDVLQANSRNNSWTSDVINTLSDEFISLERN